MTAPKKRSGKRQFLVFLNNKLMSTDTICPIVMAIHRLAPDTRFDFFVGDKATWDALNRNTFLKGTLELIGEFHFFGRHANNDTNIVLRKVSRLTWLAGLCLLVLFRRPDIIHFKALNFWPLRILYFINPSRTYLFQPRCWPRDSLESSADNLKQTRLGSVKRLGARTFVGFDGKWIEAQRELAGPGRSAHCRFWELPSSHRFEIWLSHVEKMGKPALNAELKRAGLTVDKGIIAYMLGYLGGFDFVEEGVTVRELLLETIDILVKTAPGLPILLRPHAITDIVELERIVASRPNAPLLVSHLHPAILASHARFTIANYFSVTLADATAMGSPTIEYTHYDRDLLKKTGNRSINSEYVSHFINRDRKRLAETVAKYVRAGWSGPSRPNSMIHDDELEEIRLLVSPPIGSGGSLREHS